jgi:NAD(P)H-flavin reductase
VSAPFGRRLCEVAANRDSGGYRVVSLVDREGPEPTAGQFYMLAAAEGWGARDGRAFLPRAISVAETMLAAGGGIRLDFLLDAVGPGTGRLCDLEVGEGVWIVGPLGNSFASPREVTPDAAGAVLEAVRALCAEHGVACELALESPMACGFGACFGCAVPKPGGGFLRLCVDGPVLRGDAVEEVSHAYA